MNFELHFKVSKSNKKEGRFKLYVYNPIKKKRDGYKTIIPKNYPIEAYDYNLKRFNKKFFDENELEFLENEFEKLKKIVLRENGIISLEKTKKAKQHITYLGYFNSDFLFRPVKKNTMDKYVASKNNFITFLNKTYDCQDIRFNQINNSVIKKYQFWLKKEAKWTDSTQGKFKSNLRTLLKSSEEDGFVQLDNNLFSGINFEKSKNNTIYMSKKQVQSLMKLKLASFSNLEKAQLSLVLQILLQGIRVSDLLLLRFKNIDLENERVSIISKKNNKKIIIYLDFSLKIQLFKALVIHLTRENGRYSTLCHSNGVIKARKSDIESNILKYEDLQRQFYVYKRKGNLEEGNNCLKIIETTKSQISFDFKSLLHECQDFISEEFVVPWLERRHFEGFVLSKISDKHETYIKSATSNYNNSLVDLQKMAKVVLKDNVSLRSHVMRHTWANLALDNDRSDIYSISKALGHSSLTETERYLRDFDDKKVKELTERINMDFTVTI